MRLVDATVAIPSSISSTTQIHPRPRWRTLEFRIYYVVALIVIPLMVAVPISLSSPSHPNFKLYSRRLSAGWLFGRPVDNSDTQYRSFRNNLPVLILATGLHLFSKFVRNYLALDAPSSNTHLIPFNVTLSCIMVFALHGTSIIKIAAIMFVNYSITKLCRGSKSGPLLTWVFNGFVLLMNETYHGYHFSDISQRLAFLDAVKGIHPRWHIGFNITVLRLVSFNIDHYWACQPSDQSEPPDTGSLSEKQRPAIPHSMDVYSFLNYVSYVLYTPLYIAGPIISFNDFMWQLRRPTLISNSYKKSYLIRFIVTFLTMECILHFMYVVAIKDSKAWAGETPAQISMIGFWNLIVVWLKLLIPWRFFRLWALMDGIDPPENMIRCMVNNYSTFGFWRSWHRSYNLWIIRYIYVPLGGTKHIIMNTLLVFSFVAVWHDMTFRLLVWGWLVSLFVLPELIARFVLPQSLASYGDKPWYRHVCACGAVLNILMMMVANLVGFVIGVNGIKFFIGQLLGTNDGIRFLVFACGCIFVGVQFMFEYRQEEMRNEIYRRC